MAATFTAEEWRRIHEIFTDADLAHFAAKSEFGPESGVMIALGQRDEPQARAILFDILTQNTDTHMQWSAAVQLQKTKDVRVIEFFRKELTNTDARTRAIAADILWKMGGTVSADAMLQLLIDGQTEPGYVTHRLAELGDVRAIPYLVAIVQTPSDTANDDDNMERADAADDLGLIGSPDAVPVLIAALEDIAPIVQESAADALGLIGDQRAIEPLLAAFPHSGAKDETLKAVVKLADASVLPMLHHLRQTARNDGIRTMLDKAIAQLIQKTRDSAMK